MADPVPYLEALLQTAMAGLSPELAGEDPVLRPSDHADYQANAAMKLARVAGMAPREFAERLAAAVQSDPALAVVEVAGPGFLNLTLADSFLAAQVEDAAADERLAVGLTSTPSTVVVDYSSPNVAKEMHVGHLRSTIIGDSIVRLLSFLGHRVVRQNHVGDWGTQFGMLIEHLVAVGAAGSEISDLNALYQEAKRRFDSDPAFAEAARGRVVALQAGDPETLALWHALVAESERHFEQAYSLMGVLLSPDDVRGESFYNDLLVDTVAELDSLGLTKVDDGALCVFPPGFVGRDGSPLPLIVRKSDGGFGYAATDLAGVRYRVRELGGDWLVYVVDARQSQHLAMVYAVAEMAGWLGPGAGGGGGAGGPGAGGPGAGGPGAGGGGGPAATHVSFGTVLGPDGRPFKTRSGETVRLLDLLEEAVERAAAAVESKNPGLDTDEKDRVARQVGIGAVKFADLSNDRAKDYVFDWDRMLSFDGDTGPYLQYAHARIKSIFRRVEAELGPAAVGGPVVLADPAERALALKLVSFGSAVAGSVDGLHPHRLAGYLFELASAFTTFFEACPVLRAESAEVRASRLTLCEVTARTLSLGLGLLGIDAPERM
ncbi:MAG TPA: arginine--tRNA ligase [Acidimicrobiales bacterium]|nr:arginine--tRNA ligase [Acidimicrobiales bacterium]